MSLRETLERKMTGALIGLKAGTKTITEVLPILNLLKKESPLIAEVYEKKYIAVLSARKF